MIETEKVQRVVKCTICSTVLRELNAYFCSLFPLIGPSGLRAKTSTSEPSDSSVSAKSVGEKSSLVQNSDAEAHPETLLPCTSKLLVQFRPSLSFLSDLYFGAHSSPYTKLHNNSLRRI
jgi:hypothetical protein